MERTVLAYTHRLSISPCRAYFPDDVARYYLREIEIKLLEKTEYYAVCITGVQLDVMSRERHNTQSIVKY